MVSARGGGEGATFFLSGMLLALLVILSVPYSGAQQSGYAPDSLFIALFSNGDALVEYDIKVQDPLAEEIRVRLFAESSIANLIVVDDEDNVIEFEPGNSANEIVFRTPAVSNIRISYTTQDLVDKTQGRWIFTLDNSAISFAVKLPPDSVLIDPGENFPTIRPVGNQQLLTFKPGDVNFVYVIGVLGTEEQAGIVIRLAENTIQENIANHPGIVLANATDLLKKAIEAKDSERFADAENLATKANDVAIATAREYEEAEQAIADADQKIKQAEVEGRDTKTASDLLVSARAAFESGNYASAKESASSSVLAIGSRPDEPQMPVFVIVAAAVAAGGGIGAMLFLRSRKASAVVPRPVAAQDKPANISRTESDLEDSYTGSPKVENGSAREIPTPSVTPVERLPEQISSSPATLPDSQTDTTLLARIVSKIMEEKPHLRPEDQDVLRYLAEKEGAAFESEIRTKFQLPKTTVWRLVKRLEREELVEIRKAGGQNLIKLRFESRQP